MQHIEDEHFSVMGSESVVDDASENILGDKLDDKSDKADNNEHKD